VAFRGAIDSHVRHPGERHGLGSTVYGIVSAIVVSVLWGLWHLPIIPLPPHVRHCVGRRGGPPRSGGGTLPLALLAQVGEPHGARVRACHDGLGTKRPRRECLDELGDYPEEEAQYDIYK
jgi:hypothetical protein